MEIVDCSAGAGFLDTRFDRHELSVTPLAGSAANVVCLRISSGGRVGRHRAVGHQVFAVMTGSGWVSGADGVEHEVNAGQAVAWAPG